MGQQGGRRRAGASSALWTGGAGRKEALVSQAGCIPARCAHLSGQELGCRRSRQARPPERAAAQPAPAGAPSCRGGGRRRSHSSLQHRPGLRPPQPSRLPDRVSRPLRVSGPLLNTQPLGSEPSSASPAAPTVIGSCTTLSVSARGWERLSVLGLLATGLSASPMSLEEPIGKGWGLWVPSDTQISLKCNSRHQEAT